eukprot:Nk52_evm1s125 gene=Nk52_evmTU1s125
MAYQAPVSPWAMPRRAKSDMNLWDLPYRHAQSRISTQKSDYRPLIEGQQLFPKSMVYSHYNPIANHASSYLSNAYSDLRHQLIANKWHLHTGGEIDSVYGGGLGLGEEEDVDEEGDGSGDSGSPWGGAVRGGKKGGKTSGSDSDSYLGRTRRKVIQQRGRETPPITFTDNGKLKSIPCTPKTPRRPMTAEIFTIEPCASSLLSPRTVQTYLYGGPRPSTTSRQRRPQTVSRSFGAQDCCLKTPIPLRDKPNAPFNKRFISKQLPPIS